MNETRLQVSVAGFIVQELTFWVTSFYYETKVYTYFREIVEKKLYLHCFPARIWFLAGIWPCQPTAKFFQ